MRNAAVAVFVLLVPMACGAFNVEGFTTNMPKHTVVSTAGKGRTVTILDENTVLARSPNGGYLTFNFCEGKLVSVQQGIAPDLRHVTLLFSEYKSKYGNPISTTASTRTDSTGVIYEWGTWWGAGEEYVSVYYVGSNGSESLSTSHQAKNSCFEVPR